MNTDKQKETVKEQSKETHCGYSNFKRTRYFHGMLLTDRDFREEQIYHNEKRKLLNRMLHGWGVVCGLGIEATGPGSSKIKITPGMALDCNGNEIVVCENIEMDLKDEICLSAQIKEKEKCPEAVKEGERKYYICIKYNEAPTDPVPVYTPGGGCEEKVCDYSRTREGFCIEVCAEAPPQPRQCWSGDSLAEKIYNNCREIEENGEVDYSDKCLTKTALSFKDTYCSKSVCCPGCCPVDHCIILGTVSLDSRAGNYTIKQNENRQYVLSTNFMKYIFNSLFSGAEKILADVVDEFKGKKVPDINLLHQNPVAALCWLSGVLLKQKGEQEASKEAQEIKNANSTEKAREMIIKRKRQPVGEVVMDDSNKITLMRQSFGVKNLKEGDAVEIVVDKENKPLFYIPAREKIVNRLLRNELDETKRIIGELRKRMEETKPEKPERKK